MSSYFEELDYRPTPIGALSLRRRRELSLGVDVFEIKLGDKYLMSNAELMAEKQVLGFKPAHRDLNKATMNIPSEFRIASIAPNHALILPNDANPDRMQFSERTGPSGALTHQIAFMTPTGASGRLGFQGQHGRDRRHRDEA
jgi:hypothetical protein